MKNEPTFNYNRLNILIAVVIGILSVYGVFTGWLIYIETTVAYSDTYNNMVAAGYNSIMSVPDVINHRMLILLVCIPLVGIGLVLPICWKINKEICHLYEELNRYRSPLD